VDHERRRHCADGHSPDPASPSEDDARCLSTDLVAICRPEGLGEIANLGLTLPEAKQLLASVQRAVVTRQADSHGQLRPCCRSCSGRCHLKDWRGHCIATLFGEVTVRLSPVSVHCLQAYRDRRVLAIAMPIDTSLRSDPQYAGGAAVAADRAVHCHARGTPRVCRYFRGGVKMRGVVR
jgi:hypothetical protein